MAFTLSLLAAVLMSSVVSGSSSTQDPVVVHDPTVAKVVSFAIDSHNRMCNCASAFKVVDIMSDSAELYPPTWVKYTLKLRVAETNCRNDGKVSLEDCSLKTNAQTMICSFVVLAVPGENTVPSRLLSDHCV
ncbi:uncharacterized protein zgc:194981 [Astyanax mexicanus]|uniref:Uncharacterized LOC103033956 n=2 Tax=Astyanax mexicanus TaxID=7994 RepID=A0A8B9RGA4_ASTMX|nr:uncharacterized protein zgc:194981 [Astyanax mexicanus]KAG9267050.1 hypothetical protein AMEX_G19727 [Astyanax mexicanus]